MNSSVLRLAVPSILANITIPLVGLVDVAICGHIADAAAIGGIAVGTMLFDLLYWNFGFLRVGTSGMTAQAVGKGDLHECGSLLKQALSTAVIAAAAILLLQWLFVTAVLALTPCSPEVAAFARQYFFVRVWAAPATLSLMAFKGWFIGMQNTVAPMITDLTVNLVNMLASYLLAVHSPLGAIGVAWGTLIAQYAGLLVAGIIFICKYRPTLPYSLWEKGDWLSGKRLFSLNSRLFFRSLCFMIIYVGYTALMSHFGDDELAVSAIFMKIFMLFSFFIDGFAYAAEALVGKDGMASGAVWRKTPEVKDTVRVLFLWTILLGGVCTLLNVWFADWFVGLLSSLPSLLELARNYYLYLYLMPLVSAFAFMLDGVFIGATDGRSVLMCMVWAAVAFVGCYLAFCDSLGAEAIYIGYLMHLVARSAYLFWKWMRIS